MKKAELMERGRRVRGHHTSNQKSKQMVGRTNSQVFWNSLSSQSPLATSDGVGMELSEARAPGSGKERRGDRTLEEETMAGNKKSHRTWSPSGFSR